MAKRGSARTGTLTASPELNQHPVFDLTKPRAEVDLASVWVWVERQALVVLPETVEILLVSDLRWFQWPDSGKTEKPSMAYSRP